MGDKKLSPRLGTGYKLLGLDFGKYLLSSENRRDGMESSDTATGTESELSDWEYGTQYYTQQIDNSEESDDIGAYNSDNSMFDTVIDSGDAHRLDSRRYINPPGLHSNPPTLRPVITQLNNSHNDSAYGGSGLLYPIHETGSAVSDSSGDDDNLDGTLSDSGSPVHNPVYGRYQKIHSQDQSVDEWDTLMLHRLPGENLGMILGIEGGKDGSGKVTSVTVKSVTLGGAAYRATGSNKGLCVGDEIIQVNNTDLRTLSHDECISVFKDMPLRVLLCVKRGQKNLPAVSVSPLPPTRPNPPAYRMESNAPPVKVAKRRDFSDSEDEVGSAGFAKFNVTVEKEPEGNLGLSIVPSYGSTKEYYQIKRILPSGAAAQSGLLHVGDRLVTCNGTSLRALTQNHCLSIIKSASSAGDVNFEVIRPVYDGSPMEISVTLNNSNSRLPSFDPQQFSLKSQSYDRQVDVIVTSESDDYLTVSEDEYSRKRLADIPEVEANEVFATHNVKLAYQSTIDGEVTETEEEYAPVTNFCEVVDSDIVDLNRIDTSPYHIPKKTNTSSTSDLSVQIPTSDIDNLTSSSNTKYSKDSVHHSDFETSSFTSVSTLSPRSPVPKTDFDTVSVSSSYSKRQQVPQEAGERGISPPYNYPPPSASSDIPVSDVDAVKYNPLYEDSNISDFTDTEQGPDIDIITKSYSKKNHNIPQSDIDNISVVSNRSVPYTEIDKISVHSESDNKPVRYSYSENSRDSTLPPPAEFSDHQDNNDSDDKYNNRDLYLPYTNIDDLESESTVDISPTHHEIEIVGSRHKPLHNRVDLEHSFRELERASEDRAPHISEIEDRDSAELAFNAELTAPFDSVLQDPSLCVQSSYEHIEYTDTVDNEILQVVQSYDDGTIVISQFDSQDKRESTDSPTYNQQEAQFSDSTMDTNSEAMLKDALDMEYEQLPESNKLENRVNLGHKAKTQENDFDDPNYKNENIVAQNIALEIIKQENGGVGYYVESDDEPDQYPDQDAPGDSPDLPDAPPPMLPGTGEFMDMFAAAESTSVEFTQAPSTDIGQTVTQNTPEQQPDRVAVDSNWSFKPKTYDGNRNGVDEEEVKEDIVPVRRERKVEIPPKFVYEEVDIQDDVIVPVKSNKQHQLPSDFVPVERKITEIVVGDSDDEDLIKPAPRNIVNVSVGGAADSDWDEIQEEVIEPTDSKKDKTKNIVNVISVVNAMKAAGKDKDPDIVDRIVKEDVKEKLKNKVSTVIGVSGNKLADMSPPKHEQVVTEKEEIKVSVRGKADTPKDVQIEDDIKKDVRKSTEVLPPVQTIIEETKASIKKPASKTVLNISGNAPSASFRPETIQKAGDNLNKTEHRSSIEVKKPVVETPASETVRAEPVARPRVPPATLPKPSRDKKDGVSPTLSPTTPTEISISAPIPSYKTTIGVTNVDTAKQPESGNKPDIENKVDDVSKQDFTSKIQVNSKPNIDNKVQSTSKPDNTSKIQINSKPETVNKTTPTEKRSLQPTPHIKPLSQIKPLSFNPKSLSQTKPVQYKTTISALGSKPSGLSTLGRSSLTSLQKSDLPIKRMETLPFEVSILKGILGIGIKTTMTPEGYVQVSEILPNGPVGREGNIKVGDYLLSINNTPLTGLPDSKVQQILRLLPRGLSKIVASAVPPDSNNTNGAPSEKVQDNASVPSKPASSHISKPTTLSTNSSLSSKVDTSPQVSPRSPKSISPVVSPRQLESKVSPRQTSTQESVPKMSPRSPVSPVVTSKSPISKPEQETKYVPSELANPISPKSPESKSPIASPRQLESKITLGQTETQIPLMSSKPTSLKPIPLPRQQEPEKTSPVTSPRTPPVVAPKPRRSKQTENEPIAAEIIDFVKSEVPTKQLDPNAPIETEIFASINGSKSEHTPSAQSGPSVLPGSMTYDSLQSADKTDWTPGVVSSSDIKNRDVPIDKAGKTNIVDDTNSHNDDMLTNTAPQVDTNVTSIEQNNNSEKVIELSDIKDEVIEETFEKLSKVDAESAPEISALTNRPRTFSASSDASSSYTAEFTECNVEDDLIPEQILEEEETKDDADDEYEPDFHEEESDIKQSQKTEEDNTALRAMAESIVTNVIESVKEMNLDVAENKDNEDAESAPPTLPDMAPPMVDDAPDDNQITISEYDAPPVPTSAPPPPPEEPASDVPAPVVDLTLYPDEIDAEIKDDIVDTEIYKPSYTSPMHASSQSVDVVNKETVDTVNNISNNDLLFNQVIKDTKETEDDSGIPDQSEMESSESIKEKEGDRNISDVISMYAGIDNTIDNNLSVDVKGNSDINVVEEDNSVNVNNEIQISSNKPEISVNEENESCDTKSLTSSEDIVSDQDVIENVSTNVEARQEAPAETVETNQDSVKVNGDTDTTAQAKALEKVNGHMRLPVDAIAKDIVGDSGSDSLSPRSDAKPSPRSPRSVDAFLSELESPKEKYSPELDRMIRMMSTSDEPKHTGEGELIHLKLNRGVTGLGFVIQGGKGSPKGDIPITVKKVFKGGPADGLLEVDDEIIEVDGEDMTIMRQVEARTHLKFLPTGDVNVTLRRFRKEEGDESMA